MGIFTDWVDDVNKSFFQGIYGLLHDILPGIFKVIKPHFDDYTWLKTYGSVYGFALLFYVVLIAIIFIKHACAGSDINVYDLTRSAFGRAWIAPILIILLPYFLLQLSDFINDIVQAYIKNQIDGIAGFADGNFKNFDLTHQAKFSGFWLLLLAFVWFFYSDILIFIGELFIDSQFILIISLFSSLLIVAWIYPPWSRFLYKMLSVIGTLMLLPLLSVILFFYVVNSIVNIFDGSAVDIVVHMIDASGAFCMLTSLPIIMFFLTGLLGGDTGAMRSSRMAHARTRKFVQDRATNKLRNITGNKFSNLPYTDNYSNRSSSSNFNTNQSTQSYRPSRYRQSFSTRVRNSKDAVKGNIPKPNMGESLLRSPIIHGSKAYKVKSNDYIAPVATSAIASTVAGIRKVKGIAQKINFKKNNNLAFATDYVNNSENFNTSKINARASRLTLLPVKRDVISSSNNNNNHIKLPNNPINPINTKANLINKIPNKTPNKIQIINNKDKKDK